MATYKNLYGEYIERTAKAGGVGSEEVKDWETAYAYMERGRDRDNRPLANNTRLVRVYSCPQCQEHERELKDDRERVCFHVVYHATAIVTYHFDGGFELNTGGWDTVTTWDRISSFTPRWLVIYSKREYVPMAERVKQVRDTMEFDVRGRISARIDYGKLPANAYQNEEIVHEVVKEIARELPKYKTYKTVNIFLNRSYDYDKSEWTSDYHEQLAYEDRMVVYDPHHRGRQFGLDPERTNGQSKLAQGVRDRSAWT